jgi:hypothetical protein
MPFVTKAKPLIFNPKPVRSSRIRFRYFFTVEECPWLTSESERVFVIEVPPKEVILRFSERLSEGTKLHRIHFNKPWSYMAVHFEERMYRGASIFFSNRRLKDDRDPWLYLVPLPNNDYGGNVYPGVCLGEGPSYGRSSIEKSSLIAHDSFWTSAFNDEIGIRKSGIPRGIRGADELSTLELVKEVAKKSYGTSAWIRAPGHLSSIWKAIRFFSGIFGD